MRSKVEKTIEISPEEGEENQEEMFEEAIDSLELDN